MAQKRQQKADTLFGRFSNTRKITKEQVAKLSNKGASVYKILDNSGEVLYIGRAQAGLLGKRIYQHRGSFQGGTSFRFKETGTLQDAEQLQRELIRRSKVPLNKLFMR